MCLQSARIDSTLQVCNWKQNPIAHCADYIGICSIYINTCISEACYHHMITTSENAYVYAVSISVHIMTHITLWNVHFCHYRHQKPSSLLKHQLLGFALSSTSLLVITTKTGNDPSSYECCKAGIPILEGIEVWSNAWSSLLNRKVWKTLFMRQR